VEVGGAKACPSWDRGGREAEDQSGPTERLAGGDVVESSLVGGWKRFDERRTFRQGCAGWEVIACDHKVIAGLRAQDLGRDPVHSFSSSGRRCGLPGRLAENSDTGPKSRLDFSNTNPVSPKEVSQC
jgi:hypothetical protein